MNEGRTLFGIELDRLETIGTGVFILGGLMTFQGGSELVFTVGQWVLVLGIVMVLGTLLTQRVHWRTLLERLTVLGMFTGTFGMFQPWEITRYEWGFALLGWSTLAFIVVLHIPPPPPQETA